MYWRAPGSGAVMFANHRHHLRFTLFPAAGPAILQGNNLPCVTLIDEAKYLEGARLGRRDVRQGILSDNFRDRPEYVVAKLSSYFLYLRA